MGIEKFKECQFFEHDVTEENRDYLVPCPPQDKCCFTLREHMTLDFWGREQSSSSIVSITFILSLSDSAAAEVLVRGCCSKLNQTKHHLVSSSPPPLVLTEAFKAEVLSQTIQNGPVKTRYGLCYTLSQCLNVILNMSHFAHFEIFKHCVCGQATFSKIACPEQDSILQHIGM